MFVNIFPIKNTNKKRYEWFEKIKIKIVKLRNKEKKKSSCVILPHEFRVIRSLGHVGYLRTHAGEGGEVKLWT